MIGHILKITILIFFLQIFSFVFADKAPGIAPINSKQIEKLTGLNGTLDIKENVFKINIPRTDVKIFVDQWQMLDFMGASSWIAFQHGIKSEAMLMGDLLLFEDEVNPVLDILLANNLKATALHNHFFYQNPQFYFLHIEGENSFAVLAKAVAKLMKQIKDVRQQNEIPAKGFKHSAFAKTNSIDLKKLQLLLGMIGESKEGLFKVVQGRQTIMPCGCEAKKTMGIHSSATFGGSNDNAIVAGDLAVLEEELQPTLKSLRNGKIEVVAIHNHMVGENPRLIFVHFWGVGAIADLADVIKNTFAIQKNPT